MTTLIICRGVQGSGKTTWALAYASSNKNVRRVNRDSLRLMAYGVAWAPKKEASIVAARDALISTWLHDGYDVVCDDMNVDAHNFEHLKALALVNNAKWKVQDFRDVQLETCIERDALRPEPIGENVIRETYSKHVAFATVTPPAYNLSLPDCIIVDMDGTLALMGDRSPYADDLAHLDTPNNPVVQMVMTYVQRNDTYLIIMSGRDEGRSRLITAEWIGQHLGLDDDDYQLYMRPAGDVRKDSIVKRELYDAHIAGKYNVSFVVDDRNQVVDMWRDELGLPCFQVAAGDF